MPKPSIIVVALNLDPHGGSEAGKGWWWATALSRFFELHVITQKPDALACEAELAGKEGWTFHPTDYAMTTWAFPRGYAEYYRWQQEAIRKAADIRAAHPEVRGLCHVILGSFRVLPRYDRLGLPYMLGPLGGGECAPAGYLSGREVPLQHRLSEWIRPLANRAFALVPPLRRCLSGASVALATSDETARVLERMGAPNAVAVFPDAYDVPVDVEGVMAGRREQLPAVGQTLRLLWQGRALWWKCPDLALEVLAGAVRAGVRAELTMVGDWSGEMGAALKDRAARLGIADRVTFLPGMKRDAFLALQAEHHAFLATSLHDSGGIPLIEAQARGLPCLTLGLGGNRVAACSDAGVPDGGSGPAEFVSRSVACLKKWQDAPGAWLIEAEAALRHSKTFTNARLQDYVRDHVVPAFEA